MEDLFNVSVQLAQPEEKNFNANEFKPKSSKSKKGVYEAVIRFIPNPKSPNESLVSKNTAYLSNSQGRKREVDCSNDSYNDPVASTFFQLRNSGNPILVERSKSFSRRLRYSTLVQILSCPDEPELVNQVKVFRFGKKVYDKICAEQNPSSSGVIASVPHNIFSFTDGRPFYIKLVAQGGENNFDDWSGCMFIDDAQGQYSAKCPVADQAGNIQYYAINMQTLADANFKQAIVNWLNSENIPLLEPYKYHEWDDETRRFVSQCIQEALNPNMPTQSSNTTPTAAGIFGGAPAATPKPGQVQPVIPAGAPTAAPVAPAAPVNTAPPAGGIDFSSAAPAPATAPGGFAASNVPGVDDILGTTPGQPAAPAAPAAPAPSDAPAGGIQLGDILGEIM